MRFGQDTSFVIDAGSFVLSALLLSKIRAPFSEARGKQEDRPPLLDSIRETMRFARSQPRVVGLLTVKGGYGLGTGVIALLSVFGREVFRAGAMGIGLLFAARGLGALLGPFLVRGILKRDEAQYRAIAVCVLLFGAGYCALALSKSLAVGLVAIFVAHLGGGTVWQISSYGLQRETPDFIRGRVFSADYGFVTLTMALSSIAAGLAADRYGPFAATVGTAGASLLFGVVWGLSTWRLWRRSR
jgi:predicted MFS family arabinose efflux permease